MVILIQLIICMIVVAGIVSVLWPNGDSSSDKPHPRG
jgi:hypothetical protein